MTEGGATALPSGELGLVFDEPGGGGSASFRVWAPCAAAVALEVAAGLEAVKGSGAEPEVLPLTRHDNGTWAGRFDLAAGSPAASLGKVGAVYRVAVTAPDGRRLLRRDPYARSVDYDSEWCFVDNAVTYPWQHPPLRPPFQEYIIYEMHVGSFTPQGTLQEAAKKLPHVVAAGFTAVQLMPIAEHSDLWGYNPRQLLALHRAFGTPNDLRAFVDAAHALHLAVIVDVVLHHGAVQKNALWDFDGWEQGGNGGIYHEGAGDTPWGRAFAWWKREVVEYAAAGAEVWLRHFRCDALRFDSINDLPPDVCREVTARARGSAPGALLIAELTPENPKGLFELGFDSLWCHSGLFDIVQQQRALGRGHHGGSDWSAGWDLPRLRSAMALHDGFTQPTHVVKYFCGSHDQVGCANNGGHYEDLKMIGGQKRYFVDQMGYEGRGDPRARCCMRAWYTANVAAAGIPMAFMGTELPQYGWWAPDPDHGFNWGIAEDDIAVRTIAFFGKVNGLRKLLPVLKKGWCNILHEDRQNGVLGFDRVYDGDERCICVLNAGQQHWGGTEYGVHVGGGRFQQVFCSADPEFEPPGSYLLEPGGIVCNKERGVLDTHDGKLWINLPMRCTLIFKQVYS